MGFTEKEAKTEVSQELGDNRVLLNKGLSWREINPIPFVF